MVNIKHKKQKNDGYNWKCGAICLEMIYDYYSIPYTSPEIWGKIKTKRNSQANSIIPQWFSLTHKLAHDSIDRGLPATIYKAKNAEILHEIDKLGIPAILSITQKKSNNSHFVIFKGIKNDKYYFCDPDEAKEEVYMDYRKIKDMWSPNIEKDVAGFIFLVFNKRKNDLYRCCSHCGKQIPIIHDILVNETQAIICPYCDYVI